MSFDVPFERNGKSGTNYCRPCCFYLSPYFKGWTLFSRTSGTTTTWWLTASTTLVSSLDSTWQPGGHRYQKPFQEPSVQVWNPLNQIPRVTKVKIGFGVYLEEWHDAHRGLSHLLKEHSNHRTIILTISTKNHCIQSFHSFIPHTVPTEWIHTPNNLENYPPWEYDTLILGYKCHEETA